MFFRLPTENELSTERRAWIATTERSKHTERQEKKEMVEMKCSDLPLTSGHSHIGSHLEARVDVDDSAPHHVAGKMSGHELHGGCQVVSGLVALLCVVICVGRVKTTSFSGVQHCVDAYALQKRSALPPDLPSEALSLCLYRDSFFQRSSSLSATRRVLHIRLSCRSCSSIRYTQTHTQSR